MEKNMLSSVKKLAKDTKGAFAMQFALMAVPLCVCTGLAVDGGRAFLAHFELASALDAAALAVGSQTVDNVDLNQVARKYVDANFKTEHDEPIALELATDDDKAVLKGTVKINTFFMPLVGQPYVEVNAESEVRRGGNNVEVALALDVTGSMAGTRIAGLKDAAKVLIDEVVSTTQSPYFSKAAVVPWSQSVFVNTTHANASVPVELRGTPTGTTSISSAAWRKSGTSTKTVSSAGWRTNTGKTVNGYDWKNGSAKSISAITKTDSNTRVRVTTTSSHGYSNGDAVYITGANGSFTTLNNRKFTVADVSGSFFWLKDLGTSTYTTPPTGSTAGTTGSTQRCLTTSCEIQATTSSSHGFSTGDLIYINGVRESGSGTSVNNTWGTTWTITNVATSTFNLNGTDGPTFKSYSNRGTASECYVSDCRYQVTTSTAHSLSTSDNVFIWGMSESGSATSANTAINTTINVDSPSGSVFYLPGNGNSYNDWSSGGNVGVCANTLCNVDVTSTNHGIANGDRIEITGAGGMTGLNAVSGRRTWGTTKISNDVLRLADSSPGITNMANDYTSGGTVQCLTYGCAKIARDSSASTTPYQASPCLVERYGADAATDVAPSTSPLGILYTSNGSCTQTNYVTPLTSNRTRLNASIDALTTGGSTAGQIGIGWAWYMLSPNFKTVWDSESENQPKDYTEKQLVKVAVLMTDGEFNYSTCSGLSAGTLCTPAKDEFQQAEDICAAMKAQRIVIYTVGLELDTSLYADDFLTKCASSPAYAFLAADVNELKVAFKKIATSISKLRLAR